MPVEGGLLGNPGQLPLQLADFGLQRQPIGGGVGIAGRLDRQLAYPLENGGGLLQCALGGLGQRDSIIGIPHRLIKTANLRAHPVGDGQAGGIIPGAVDPQAGGESLE